MEKLKALLAFLGTYRKAVVAFAGVLVSSLLLVLAPDGPPDTLAEIDTVQWLIIAGAVLGIGGGVAATPNKPAQ